MATDTSRMHDDNMFSPIPIGSSWRRLLQRFSVVDGSFVYETNDDRAPGDRTTIPLLKCNGVQRVSAAFAASR